MSRRDIIIACWIFLPLGLSFIGIIGPDTIGELICWLISDIVVMIVLVLPELFYPYGKLAKWLTTRVPKL